MGEKWNSNLYQHQFFPSEDWELIKQGKLFIYVDVNI